MTALKLGRQPRRRSPLVPHMSALTAGLPLPAPAPSVDWTVGMNPNFGMMKNDVLGDCTIAAAYHLRQVWTFHAKGSAWTPPDSDVELLYERACGYQPGNAATDQGGDEQSVLTYWLKHGAPVGPSGKALDHIAAFVEVDPRNTDDVRRAIGDCGGVYIGFQVPAYLMSAGPPDLWDVDPAGDQSIVGGHAVVLPAYDVAHFGVISWGQRYGMTSAFFEAFVDEVYAIADVDWINAKGTTPGGIPLSALETQMAALKA